MLDTIWATLFPELSRGAPTLSEVQRGKPRMYQAMRTLEELLEQDEPAWPMVQEWIGDAKNHVEVLSPRDTRGDSLVALPVTTRSPLGGPCV